MLRYIGLPWGDYNKCRHQRIMMTALMIMLSAIYLSAYLFSIISQSTISQSFERYSGRRF